MSFHQGGPLRRLRKCASLRRGEHICAQAFYDLHRKSSMFADRYVELEPIARRKRVGKIVLGVKSALETINDKEVLAPLEELHDALILSDAGVLHPILAKDTQVRGAERRLLGLEGNQRRLRDDIGAFCLATVEKLTDEGVQQTEAFERVARHAGVTIPALKDWQKRLRRDNAVPFRPMLNELHRQRLSFRVRACLGHAERERLSGKAMLKCFRKDPALVRRLSMRLAR